MRGRERPRNREQTVALRDEGGKPAAEPRSRRTFCDHPPHEGDFATATPEFVVPSAEVQRRCALPAPAPEIAELACGARGRGRRGGVKRGVAEARRERFTRANDSAENRLRRRLPPDFHAARQHRVRLHNPPRGGHGDGINLRADKAPVVFNHADNGVNAIGSDSDIEDRHGRTFRDGPFAPVAQQVRQHVNIVRTPWNGRTQIPCRKLPFANAVVVPENRTIQAVHRRGIGKIDRGLAGGIGADKVSQKGLSADQCRERISSAMTIPSVQLQLWLLLAHGVLIIPRDRARATGNYRCPCVTLTIQAFLFGSRVFARRVSADSDSTDVVPPTPPPLPNGGSTIAAGPAHTGHSAAHGPIHTHCENCGTELRGPYCYRCGQHDFPFHASFRHVAYEALENFFHFEGKFFTNVVTLLFRPGELTAAFNRGQRASQMPPFRLYLFVSVLFFVTLVLSGARPAPNPETKQSAEGKEAVSRLLSGQANDKEIDPLTRDVLRRARERRSQAAAAKPHASKSAAPARTAESVPTSRIGRLFEPMVNESFREKMWEEFLHTVPKLLLLALPIFALYSRVLFRGAGQVYLQHLVVALHYHTFVFLWSMATDGWSNLAALISPGIGSGLHNLCDLWGFAYPFLMLRRLFANTWGWTIVKTAMLIGGYGITLAVIFAAGFLLLLSFQ